MLILPFDAKGIEEGVVDFLNDLFDIRRAGYIATHEVGSPSVGVPGSGPSEAGQDTPPVEPVTPPEHPNPAPEPGPCDGMVFPLRITIPVCVPVTIVVSYTIKHCIIIGNVEHCSPVTITSKITTVSCTDVTLKYHSCEEWLDETTTGGAGVGAIPVGTTTDVDYGMPTTGPSGIPDVPEYHGWDSGAVVDDAIDDIPEIWETGEQIVNQLGTLGPSTGSDHSGRGSQPQLELRTDLPSGAGNYLQDMHGFDIGAGWGYIPPSGLADLLNLLRDYLSMQAEEALMELIRKGSGAWVEIQRVPAHGKADSGTVISY